MKRSWGYIVMSVTVLIAFGALMLPLPETFVVPQPPAPEKPAAESRPEASRPKAKPARKPVARPAAPAPVKKIPKQDTVKRRVTAPR